MTAAASSKPEPPGGLEIDFPDATALFVTPGGPLEGKYYLHLNIVRLPIMDGTTGVAHANFSPRSEEGLMGPIPPDSWLPRLPNNTSPLGPMPMPPDPQYLHKRYIDLYQKFGEAWRVKDSLFYWPDKSAGSSATGHRRYRPTGHRGYHAASSQRPNQWSR